MDGQLAKFESLILESDLAIAICRNLVDGGFTFRDISPTSDRPANAITREELLDLIAREGFVGLTAFIGIEPQFAFAVELTDSELSAIRASLLRLFERALIRVESSFTGVSEDLLQKLHILPQISTEEN
jgi:hypothetical protein